jgi:hypothetical protein
MDSNYYTEQVYGTSFIFNASCNLFKIVYISLKSALGGSYY